MTHAPAPQAPAAGDASLGKSLFAFEDSARLYHASFSPETPPPPPPPPCMTLMLCSVTLQSGPFDPPCPTSVRTFRTSFFHYLLSDSSPPPTPNINRRVLDRPRQRTCQSCEVLLSSVLSVISKTTIQCTPFNLQPHPPKLEPHSH